MNLCRKKLQRLPLLGLVLVPLCMPEAAKACAACFGETGSPMSAGLSAGVLVLFGVVVVVLGGIAGFFIYLAKRAAKMNAPAELMNQAGEQDNPYGLFNGLPNFGK